MSTNGRLPASALTSIGGGKRLEHASAAQFKLLTAAVKKATGRALTVNSAYRTYAEQAALWNGGKNKLAAAPEYSNHGLGKSVDVNRTGSDTRYLSALDALAGLYGFVRDVANESWHFTRRIPAAITDSSGRMIPRVPAATAKRSSAYSDRAAQLQALLNVGRLWGWYGGGALLVDGRFGAATEAQLRRLQGFLGVSVDGVFGPVTRAAVVKAVDARVAAEAGTGGGTTPTAPARPKKPKLPTATLRQGSSGTQVRRWQEFLNWARTVGIVKGDRLVLDGKFGPATDKATRAFQRARKIGVDGIVGPQTRAAAKAA